MNPTAALSKFSPEQREAVLQWVNFVADRIHKPGWEERFYAGLDNLVVRAEKLWPRLMEGKDVKLTIADLGEPFDGVDEFEAWEFVATAGHVLFNGVDGPRATAVALRHSISSLAKRRKG